MKKPKLDRRCAALDSKGRRCTSKQTRVDGYTGNGEVCDYLPNIRDEGIPAWVFVRLCNLHHPFWGKAKGKRGVV